MRPGSFAPGPMSQLADLQQRVADLERRFLGGSGVSTAFGADSVRTMQPGFPAELTSLWSPSTGYSWKRLDLDDVALVNPSVQLTGDHAVPPDEDATLTAGTRGWIEPDRSGAGWIFIVGGDGVPPTSFGDVIGPDCALTGQLPFFSDPNGRFIGAAPGLVYDDVAAGRTRLTRLTLSEGLTPRLDAGQVPKKPTVYVSVAKHSLMSLGTTSYVGGAEQYATVTLYGTDSDRIEYTGYTDASGHLVCHVANYVFQAAGGANGRHEVYAYAGVVRDVVIGIETWMYHFAHDGTPGVSGSVGGTVFKDGIATSLGSGGGSAGGDVWGPDSARTGQLAVFTDPNGRFIGGAQNIVTTLQYFGGHPSYDLTLTLPESRSGKYVDRPATIINAFSFAPGTVDTTFGTLTADQGHSFARVGAISSTDNAHLDLTYFSEGQLVAHQEHFRFNNNAHNAFVYTQVNPGIGKVVRYHTSTTTDGFQYWMKHYTSAGTAGASGTAAGGTVFSEGLATALAASIGTYTTTNVTTDRAFDANATTLDEIADVLGTLIADLKTRGILG